MKWCWVFKACVAGAIVSSSSIPYASAALPAARDLPVGIVNEPCNALEPMPAALTDYLKQAAQAQAAHQSPPVPSKEGRAIYDQWQQRRLQQDFGGLCRYDSENSSLPPATDHRVIFFGDSITERWRLAEPEFFSGDVLDRGVIGQTTSQMVVRFRADVIDLHPRVVHILAGTNDVAGNTGPTSLTWVESNIQTMVEMAQAHHIVVVLGTVPPTSRFDWRPSIDPKPSTVALNAWIRQYAQKAGIEYVDYFNALDDGQHGFKPSLTVDGVHPNADGYRVMQPMAKKAIEAQLRP